MEEIFPIGLRAPQKQGCGHGAALWNPKSGGFTSSASLRRCAPSPGHHTSAHALPSHLDSCSGLLPGPDANCSPPPTHTHAKGFKSRHDHNAPCLKCLGSFPLHLGNKGQNPSAPNAPAEASVPPGPRPRPRGLWRRSALRRSGLLH